MRLNITQIYPKDILIKIIYVWKQGEVESIAMMKPKAQNDNECGHLEYLEDIIGTTRYKEPLEKIHARVDILSEERTEKHNRCKMAERELNDLKAPMEEAVAFLKLENDLTRTKNKETQLHMYVETIKFQLFNLLKFSIRSNC